LKPYHELPGFEHVYLEDSWVLEVLDAADEFRLRIDVVLTEQHPRWTTPKPDEVYSYASASLVFANPRRVEWTRQAGHPATDASGEIDWGHIDSFIWDETRFELEGDWGAVIVEGDAPQLLYADD
jgi:hypothetical protein